MKIRVMKFGGTSVGSRESLASALRLVSVSRREVRPIVVVSALHGVTNQLIEAVERAVVRALAPEEFVAALAERHRALLGTVADGAFASAADEALARHFARLAELLSGVSLLREVTPQTRDLIVAMGERLAVPIFVAGLRQLGLAAVGIDATELIATDSHAGEAAVLWDETKRRTAARIGALEGEIPVITGFLGADPSGATTLLGRGASDYTATLLGAALGAERVEIWTDVAGVLSADPRLLSEVFTVPELTYGEAAELAFYGAKVLHSRCVLPAAEAGVPIHIGNTFAPQTLGTWIRGGSRRREVAGPARGVAALLAVTLFHFESSEDLGIPDLASKLLALLARARVPVLFVSQSSYSSCLSLAVAADAAVKVEGAVAEHFAAELASGRLSRTVSRERLSLVAAVGEDLTTAHDAGAQAVSDLEREQIRVLAHSASSSSRSLVVIVREADLPRAMELLHSQLVLARRRVALVVAGASGRVGRALTEHLGRQQGQLRETLGIDLQLVAAANRRQMVWSGEGLAAERLEETLATGEPANFERLVARLLNGRPARTIFVDCTASDEVASSYSSLLGSGVAVVTPNKRANTRTFATYRELKEKARASGVPYLYETTVGAALPVLRTLRDLRLRGDRLNGLAATLSGTLSYILGRVNEGIAFSVAVAEAHENGLTEPHPAEDLAGEDVARKLLILLREVGLGIERESVLVESLVPAGLEAEPDAGRFVAGCSRADETWEERARTAAKAGQRLVHVARFERLCGERITARVAVEALPESSPLAGARPGENIIMLWTDQYAQVPLTIAGLGAGPAITAAGVLSDVLEAAHALV